jgi:hypothetical protein
MSELVGLSDGQIANQLELARCRQVIMEWEENFPEGKFNDSIDIIVENLYLADRTAVERLDLSKFGVKAVLNAATGNVKVDGSYYGRKVFALRRVWFEIFVVV